MHTVLIRLKSLSVFILLVPKSTKILLLVLSHSCSFVQTFHHYMCLTMTSFDDVRSMLLFSSRMFVLSLWPTPYSYVLVYVYPSSLCCARLICALCILYTFLRIVALYWHLTIARSAQAQPWYQFHHTMKYFNRLFSSMFAHHFCSFSFNKMNLSLAPIGIITIFNHLLSSLLARLE